MQQPIYTDNSTLLGDGTIIDPLVANGPAISALLASLGLGANWPMLFGVVGLKTLQFVGQLGAAGQTTFYTVPAGRRAIFVSLFVLNLSGAVSSISANVGIGGTFFLLNAPGVVNNNVAQNFSPLGYTAEAGESFSINSTGAPGFPVNFSCVVFEFSATSLTASAKLSPSAIVAGNNTIFTCPAGFLALLGTPNLPVGDPAAVALLSGPSVGCANQSGASRTYNVFLVPNGSTPLASNQLRVNTLVGNLSQQATLLLPSHILNAGDSIVVNSDSNAAGQLIFTNYCLRTP